jgi:hypothetical protein
MLFSTRWISAVYWSNQLVTVSHVFGFLNRSVTDRGRCGPVAADFRLYFLEYSPSMSRYGDGPIAVRLVMSTPAARALASCAVSYQNTTTWSVVGDVYAGISDLDFSSATVSGFLRLLDHLPVGFGAGSTNGRVDGSQSGLSCLALALCLAPAVAAAASFCEAVPPVLRADCGLSSCAAYHLSSCHLDGPSMTRCQNSVRSTPVGAAGFADRRTAR